jgi:WD40 repeat protein
MSLTACGGGGGGGGAATGGAPIASPKAIVSYSLANVTGTINETNKTIAVTVPFGTNVTALIATFSITGASVSVGGTTQVSGITANDFTNPITYTVTGLDGTTANYVVTVTIVPSSAKAITAYSLAGYPGIINEANKAIAVGMPSGTAVTTLVAAFTTTGARVSVGGTVQASGVTQNNFTNLVVYTVMAANGSAVNYTVTVTLLPPATIGGTVNGLATGNSIGLLDNGVDSLTLTADGSFTFAQAINYGSAYNVTIGTLPVAQPCTHTYSAGTATANVSNVNVICGPAFVGAFTATGAMSSVRDQHTATLLPNGKVLVAGGLVYGGTYTVLNGAELYDPATGTWATTGPMANARYGHTATLLPNGKVLVAGGINAWPASYTATAEIYDPTTGLWSTAGTMAYPRIGHTAIQLANGKVLVAGGGIMYDATGVPNLMTGSELYDPVAGTWSPTGNMLWTTTQHTATLLANGKVLVAAGSSGYLGNYYTNAELYDPNTGTWTATGSLAAKRYSHAATMLPSGKVLVTGGTSGMYVLSSAELYDPITGTWATTGPLTTTRYNHMATLTPTGKVLVTGGSDGQLSLMSAELYDPIAGIWAATAGSMTTTRQNHTATLLTSGKLLLTGGPGAAAELFW